MPNKFFLRSWVLYSLLTFAIIAAVILPLLHLYDKNRLKLDISHDIGHILKAAHQLQSMFHERTGDIHVLAQSPCLAKFLAHPTRENRHAATQIMHSICRYYSIYDQIRLIRADGQELVRINFDDGKCSKVTDEDLQNKVNRYYFEEALMLPADQIFISPMDLNVEHGKIEVPHKPMIRFAMPIKDQKETIQAVLVMNFLGRTLLENLFEQNPVNYAENIGHYSFLVNAQGEYLKSELFPEKEFAFMFDDKQDQRFSLDFPDAWQAALEGDEEIRTDQGIFLIKALPVPISVLKSQKVDVGRICHSTHWYLFHFMSKESIKDKSIIYGPAQPILIAIHIFVSMLFGYLLAQRNFVLKQQKKDAQTIRDLYKKMI